MPLILRRNYGTQTTLGIWRTDEGDAYIQGSAPRMKLQRLAVRVLLKKLTGVHEISYTATGKPFLRDGSYHISLTHTNDMVAVIADRESATGIDIEQIKSRIHSIASKFMSDEEMKNIRAGWETEQLHVYWCAKEALYKLNGEKELIFKEALLISPFHYDPGGGELEARIVSKDMNRGFKLCYEKTGDHMLVYVSNT
jgi:4'-phosphopantetheinyl transferase